MDISINTLAEGIGTEKVNLISKYSEITALNHS